MASQLGTLGTLATLATLGSLAVVIVILASILGAVEGRERFGFVGGIALVIVAHAAIPSHGSVAAGLAVIGILVATASTIPLLRQPT